MRPIDFDTLLKETTPKFRLLLSEKGSTLKGKNLLLGANSSLLEQTSFQKGLSLQEANQEATKNGCLPCKMAQNVASVSRLLSIHLYSFTLMGHPCTRNVAAVPKHLPVHIC